MDYAIMSQDIKEIKNQLNDLRVDVATLPQKFFEKADCRYASKILEVEVHNLKKTQDSRTYEWLKYSIMIIVTVFLTLILGKYAHLINL